MKQQNKTQSNLPKWNNQILLLKNSSILSKNLLDLSIKKLFKLCIAELPKDHHIYIFVRVGFENGRVSNFFCHLFILRIIIEVQ